MSSAFLSLFCHLCPPKVYSYRTFLGQYSIIKDLSLYRIKTAPIHSGSISASLGRKQEASLTCHDKKTAKETCNN